ncbi:MAG: hypothetical protein JRI23_09920 [Deltaproteobacteria bacterium]|jgi:hypothetical protein|nr:hypothetical protein [Deltaproteobacteria bacterium]MBW2531985.1 hypothetical protein [Deltaproteobacteria bacterium]
MVLRRASPLLTWGLGRRLRALIPYLVATVVTLVCVEVVLYRDYRTSAAPQGIAGPLLASYYLEHDVTLIQLEEACARYDQELTYTLRPGQCRFGGREFDTLVRVNSLGLRDDEASLEQPRIIVLGDSFAMGWGVEQEQSFPELLERELGRPVLNAAIASYGTAREIMSLRRLDCSALEVLVIQYHPNDFVENRAFLEHAARLPTRDEASYRRRIADYRRRTSGYRPGGMLYKVLRRTRTAVARGLRSAGAERRRSSRTPRAQAEAFVGVLRASPVRLEGVTILIVEAGATEGAEGGFITALKEAQREAEVPTFIRELHAVPVAPHLSPEDSFAWDGHYRASGHRIVADRLLAKLRELEFH